MLRAMARGLVQEGLTVDVATTDDNGPGRLDVLMRQPVLEDGVTYRYFPRQTRFYTFSLPLTRWLAEHVKDYDLVHVHGLFSYAAMPAAYWANRYGVPYIVRPFGVLNRWGMRNRRPWLKRVSFKLIESRILSGAAVVHYTSEQECSEATELGVPHRSVVIPNAIEIPTDIANSARGCFRKRHPELANRPIILFLSRLDQKKGLDLLLNAFAKIVRQHPSALLVIAGDGEPAFVEALKQQANTLGIASAVLWTGFLAGADKWAALRDADIFVLPSYSENFGIAVVEAMAFGVPVVVSDQVAIYREIREAKAGLATACDSRLLTNALNTLMVDDQLRTEMGNNGRRLTEAKFTPAVVWHDLLKVYRKIIAARTVRSLRP